MDSSRMRDGLTVTVDGVIYQRQSRGGISRLYSEILPRMCAMDESLHIILLTRGRLRQSLPEHPRIAHRAIFPVRRYLRPGRVWKPVIPPIRRLIRRMWIGRGEGQIWHSTYFTMPPSGWEGMQVVTVYDMIYELFSDLSKYRYEEQFRIRKRKCVMAADAVIAISETTKEDLIDIYGLDSGKVWAVPLGYTKTFKRLEDAAGILPSPFILYVGGDNPRKGFDTLAKAYSKWEHRDSVELVSVGAGRSEEGIKRLEELGIIQNVRALGRVDDETLRALYNTAEAFVYPSLYEGFGIPLLEAMACGCPIVASRMPSTLEVAENVPIYFEPGQPEDLMCALDNALLEGRNSRRALEGLSHVKRYSWDKTAKQTIEVYKSILAFRRSV